VSYVYKLHLLHCQKYKITEHTNTDILVDQSDSSVSHPSSSLLQFTQSHFSLHIVMTKVQ